MVAVASVSCFGVGKVDEDNWGEKYAKAQCDFMKRCLKAYFFSEYDDNADCVDEVLDDWEDYEDDDCDDFDLDDDKAEDCLELLNSSCEDIADDIDDLYEDCYGAWEC